MKEITAINQLKELKRLGKKKNELRLAAESWNSPFQILVSTMMSARTRDEVTIPVAEQLFKNFPTAKKLSSAKISKVEKLIRPVNFYKNKSRNILNCSKEICKRHKGKVPLDIELLISLPGVGRKTANVFLSELGVSAIGVDTHVNYVSNYLGWTKNKNPDKIESDLQKLFTKKHWKKINPILVRFGKTHTSKRKKDEALDKIKKIK